MIRRPARCALVLCALALWPSAAPAQQAAFEQGLHDLAVAIATPHPDRPRHLAGAVHRMAAALDEWDRQLADLEEELHRDGRGTSAERQAALGRAYLDRGKFDAAARALASAADATPRSAALHLARALALDAAGRPDAAAAAYRAAWDADPSSPIAACQALQRGGLTEPHDRRRARSAAVDAYTHLVAAAPQPPSRPFVTAGALVDSLVRTPVVADAVTAEGVALLVAHRYREAVVAFQRAGVLDGPPGDHSPLARFARGRHLEAMHRIADARRELEAAAAGTLVGRSALFAGLGRLAQIEGDFAAAAQAFEQALLAHPNDAALRQELARAYLVQDRAEEAHCQLVAAALIDPRDARAHAAIGQLLLDEGRDADAAAALRRALALAPDAYEARYALAAAFARLGRSADAARELELYERTRREMLERQRRQMAGEVGEEEARRRRLAGADDDGR